MASTIEKDRLQSDEASWLEDETGLVKDLPEHPPQILAPAGGRAQFMTALHAGADAVYLGLQSFNARARADNFTIDELRELVPLAHHFGMEVLVTLNVLIKEQELPDMLRVLGELESLKVDAVIVQDFGVVQAARTHFPGLRLHASTQMAIHNVFGVKEAAAAGLKRVVLARETTTVELKRIFDVTQSLGIELEAFCHGSLCYSYSGLCFFSGAEDARSGNRGECAYTCRKPYKIISEPGHGFLFSMKDLDTSHQLERLIRTGVKTLKIEGRKKDAQYVSSVVRLYRKKLDDLYGFPTGRRLCAPESDQTMEELQQDLNFSFQRAKTSFFLKGRYRENGIDLENPTHKGVFVGAVEQVDGDIIRLRVSQDLAKYDGLKVDGPESLAQKTGESASDQQQDHQRRALSRRYKNEVQQFSLRDMFIDGKRVNSAPSGSLVEIKVPAFKQKMKRGDLLFKMRSVALKERTEPWTKAPSGYRLKSLRLVETFVRCDEGPEGVELKVTVRMPRFAGALELATETRSLSGEKAKDPAKTKIRLEEAFTLFGDAACRSEQVVFEGFRDAFIPPKILKEIKRSLSQGLRNAYDQAVNQRVQKSMAKELIQTDVPAQEGQPGLGIKVDRLEYLAYLTQILAELGGASALGLRELVFEPKRAFLGTIKPDEAMNMLKTFSDQHRVAIRFALPTLIRAWDEPLLKLWVRAYSSVGQHWEIGNPGGAEMLKEWGLNLSNADLASDFTGFCLNHLAAEYLRLSGINLITLSVEDDRENITQVVRNLPKGQKAQLVIYKDTPLFMAEACSLTALHGGCPSSKVCGYRSLTVENDEGERYHVAHESCKSVVYGDKPFSLIHTENLLVQGIHQYRIDFLTRPYSQEMMGAVLRALKVGSPVDFSHSANYHGELL